MELTSQARGVLTIPAAIFEENYNMPITEFVDRHTFKEQSQKGGAVINYMSHASATRLFRIRHPNLKVVMVENPATGGFVFEEAEGRGFFLKGYITDGINDSEVVYFGVLGSSGNAVLPGQKDKGNAPIASSKAFNTAYVRAKTKIIAMITGLGLKLWTGDDLDEDIKDAKIVYLKAIDLLAAEYYEITGKTYVVDVSILDTEDVIKATGKAIKQAITSAKQIEIEVDNPVTGELVLESADETTVTSRKSLKAS
jgi:hypothetical protein